MKSLSVMKRLFGLLAAFAAIAAAMGLAAGAASAASTGVAPVASRDVASAAPTDVALGDIQGCRLHAIQGCRHRGFQRSLADPLRRRRTRDQRLPGHARRFRGQLDGVADVLAGRVMPAVRPRLLVPVRRRDRSRLRLPPDLPLAGGDDSDARLDPGTVLVVANRDETRQRNLRIRWKRRSRS